MEQNLFNLLTSHETRNIMHELMMNNEVSFTNENGNDISSIMRSSEHMNVIGKIFSKLLEKEDIDDRVRNILNLTLNFTSIDPDNQHERQEILTRADNIVTALNLDTTSDVDTIFNTVNNIND